MPTNRPPTSPICRAQVACDGAYVTHRSKDKTTCYACRTAIERKNKPPKPLRGEKLYPEDVDV